LVVIHLHLILMLLLVSATSKPMHAAPTNCLTASDGSATGICPPPQISKPEPFTARDAAGNTGNNIKNS
jgi:hypothetical protein